MDGRLSHDYRGLEEAQKDIAMVEESGGHGSAPPQLPFKITNQHVRECLSEFLSTFIYAAFGLGVNAQVILSKAAAGNYTSVTLGWGVAVMLAMHVGGGVSHSHINPAITIALAVYGVFPWKKVPGYVISQTLGALVGSLMIYTMFYQLIHLADPTKTTTSVIFHTHPNALVNNSAAFLTEFFATMVLLICLLALVDEKNRPTVVPSFPSCVGILVVGIGMSFSLISSAALNPARDLGPRIMLTLVGYDGVFSANNHYFWIPIVAPTLGAIVGCGVYLVLIMAHHPAKVNNKGFF
ncbi:Aquaporin, partial [Globisporangium splendens]